MIWALIGLLIVQQIFYMRQVQILVDKLMSRSFYDYQQTIKPPVSPPKILRHPGAIDTDLDQVEAINPFGDTIL